MMMPKGFDISTKYFPAQVFSLSCHVETKCMRKGPTSKCGIYVRSLSNDAISPNNNSVVCKRVWLL